MSTTQFTPKGIYNTVINEPRKTSERAGSGRPLGSSASPVSGKELKIFTPIELAQIKPAGVPFPIKTRPGVRGDLLNLLADVIYNNVVDSEVAPFTSSRSDSKIYYSMGSTEVDNVFLPSLPTAAWKIINRRFELKIASPWMPNLRPPTDSMIENNEEVRTVDGELEYVVLPGADPGPGAEVPDDYVGSPTSANADSTSAAGSLRNASLSRRPSRSLRAYQGGS